MISVVLASRLNIIREGMKRIILQQEDMKVVAEVRHTKEVLAQEGAGDADVVVVAHPSASGGNDYLAYLRQECPALRVIVVARSPTLPEILAALRMGVRGLLNSSCAVGHLPAAIRAVASGKIYLHDEISRLVAADLKEVWKDHTHKSLTAREFEIFMRLAVGCKVTEIATELAISVKTVSTHKARLMEKMRIVSTSQLIQYAIVNKMFDADVSE